MRQIRVPRRGNGEGETSADNTLEEGKDNYAYVGLFNSTSITYTKQPITLLYSGEEICSGHYDVLLKIDNQILNT